MRNLLLTLRSALLLLLLLCTVPNAFGYDSKPNFIYHNGIKYRITSDGTIAVTNDYTYEFGLGDIVIPSTITTSIYNYGEDYNMSFVVTAVDPNAFQYCSMLTSIELPPTVKSIGASAFNRCSGLTSVTLSSGLETIGRTAFGGCTSLQSITIPNSVTSMDWNTFYGCTALTQVTLSNHLRELNGTFYGCSSLESIRIPTSVVSLNGTFTNCTSLNTVAIPNSVTQIGDQTFMGCSGLVSVYIPNSVTQIANQAFSNTSLTVVEIPNTVTQLGTNVFQGCNQLTSVTSRAVNPPTMSSQNTFDAWIYENAKLTVPLISKDTYKARNWWNLFQDITGSQALDNAYDFVANGIYYNKVDENHVEVTYKDNNYNSYSGSVSVPTSVTHEGKTYSVTGIGNNAFNNCASLTSVTLPATITAIGSNAFANSGLTALNLPDAVTTIATRAFYGCSKISNLIIPQNITSIGKEAFAGCNGLTQLTWNAKHCWTNGDITTTNLNRATIGSAVEVLPVGFVAQSKITAINIPASVAFIGSNAFKGCSSLTGITIPKSVTNIGANAFADCTGLTSLTWNAKDCNTNGNMYVNNITQVSIGNEVETLPVGFVAQSKITTISIPGSVKNIGSLAFRGCSQLTNLTLPEATKSIGEYAFYGCSAFTSLTIPRNVIAIGYYAFDQCDGLTTLNWNAINCTTNGDMTTSNLTQVNIGNEVTKLPIDFARESKITAITIPNSVDSICSEAFYGCTSLTDIILPNSLIYIGGYVFYQCTGLTNIDITNSVTSIGYYAFYGCTGLTDVTIGDAVTSIGYSAFSYCTGLTEISIPNSVTSIDDYAFNGCTGLTTVYFYAENCSNFNSYSHPFYNCPIDRIVIGDKVKKIPTYFAFGITGLTEITIPNSVSSIGNYAFSGCSRLESVFCWAFEPPSLGYDAFNGVSSSMCIYVPSIALDSYKSASRWNQYIILPMDDSHVLSVSLPENVNVQDYNNMRLEVTNMESDEARCYTITNKSSYKFSVDPNSSWNVKLTNQYGDLFGKIEHVEVGEENVNVAFPSLLKPRDVSLVIKKPNGQDVTDQCHISWCDEDGELLLQGNPIKKLPAGRKLKYQVMLPQELATAFTLPATNIYTVNDGNNNITCQLASISQTQLCGKVKDAITNQALYGATISAVQSFGGGRTKTLTTKTDNQGQYSLDASIVPTTLTIAANGYISQTVDCDMASGDGSTVTVPDVALSPITGAVVNINLTYTPAHAEGEAAETQNFYSDYSNVDYELYNMTSGHALTNASVQYPQIVLMEDVNDGDVLELTATSRKNAFKPVKTTVTIAEQRATATFNIKQLGQISAAFNKNINPKVSGTLYDAESKLVKSSDYRGSTLSLEDVADGDYKLITMGKSDFFNSIYDLDQFTAAGLTEGDDYVKNEVQVESGLISKVTIDEVPFFDESKFYYTGEYTSFSVNKPSIVVGNYLTFRAQLDFKEQYANLVSDVQLIVDLPESCSFIDNSVMAGPNMAGYSTSGNRITVPLQNWNDVVVRFCAIPTLPGGFAPSAFVRFKLNGKTITQPIGKAQFTAKGLSIEVPSLSADTTIQVSGTADRGQSVRIYDGSVLIGQTQCRTDGYWSASVDLYKPHNHPYHRIQAEIEMNQGSKQGLTLMTESKIVEYDKNAILVSKVTQYNEQRGPTPYLITLDFLNPDQPSQHYSYDMYDNHRTFTYTIDFTNNSAVSNVMLYVRTAWNHWWPLAATYNAQKDLWVTAGEFGNALDADLPVNVAVDYEYEHKTEDEDVNEMLQDLANSLNEVLSEIDAAYDNSEIENIYEDGNTFSFSVIPDGYTNKEEYTITSIDYSIAMNQIKNSVNNPTFTIVNDTINIGFTLNVNENHNSIIIWDHNSHNAFQIANVNVIPLDSSERSFRIFPFINLAITTYDIITSLANFYFDLQEINGWENTIVQDLERQDRNYEKLLSMINSLCENGEYKIKDTSRRAELESYALSWWVTTHNQLTNLQEAVISERDALWTNLIVKGLVQVGLIGISKACSGLFAAQEWCQPLLKELNSLTRGISGEKQLEAITSLYLSAINQYLGLDEGFNVDQPLKEIISEVHRATLNKTMDEYAGVCQTIKSSYSDCKEEPDYYWGVPYLGPDMTFCIDPSGFVYEGVPSNRLQGVTATCYYKETVEDMYGDPIENVVLWDAENYGQENPLITDENGYYRWDVPVGMWQVKYEKEGYETTYSDWLPVPPPQLDVNIGMVQMRQPEVIKARAYPKAVEFEFDKFMLPEDLTTSNIRVIDYYGAESGTIELLNAEVDDPNAITSIRRAPGTGLTLASKVRFNSDYPFYGNEVTLKVSKRVKSYAGLEMAEDYEVTLPIEYEMEKIDVDTTLTMPYGDSRELTVTVLPANASRGKTLSVRSVAPMIATTDAETYTLNNNGQASITVHGDLPGMTSLLYSIEDYDLTASTLVNVMMESQMTVAAPTASIASGSTVEKGTAVYLRCATEGATIYYTLDGSCPCDNTPARKAYDGNPIIINSTSTIKAMATAPDLYDSEVATFVYRVGNGLKGDVNGDGEINIADVNAIIDIILGGKADADTRERADVNEDGEINIADINAVTNIILSPSHLMLHMVNCNDKLHLDNVSMKPGDVRILQVNVDHASLYSAMQCDIVLPAGLTILSTASTGDRLSKIDHFDGTTSRVLSYSPSKMPFASNNQGILTLTVRADEALAAGSEILLTNVVLADTKNKAWHLADCVARVDNASGVNDLTAVADRIWVEGQMLFIEARHDGTAQLATINGVVCDLPVKAGINQHRLEPGIYIVVINGVSHKIAIK